MALLFGVLHLNVSSTLFQSNRKRLSEQLLLMTPSHHQNLDDIFKLQLASFVYACMNRLAPPVFDNYFNYISNIHDHNTRQADRGDIFIERRNTMQYGIKTVRYAGTQLWNSIPIEIRRSPSISTFRSNFLKFLLSGYSSS